MKKASKKKKTLTFLVIFIDICAAICFFLAYGPISYFRDLLVTTAMTTMNHKYFAYVLYSEETVEKILDNNKIIESDVGTDTSAITFNPDFSSGTYSSEYERQVLEKDEGNDVYKYVDIKGKNWKGYMVVIYDPADVQLVFSKKFGGTGEYISTMAKNNKAYVAMTGSGVYHTYGNKNTGTTILNGKVYFKGRKINKGGGLIGFTKDNVLMLTKDSAKNAIAAGMDRAVEFGPFLVVNGVKSTFKGNGGWGIANRSAIGQRPDGIVLFIVIDGRQSGSVGISMADLADLFQKYGCINAANLDDGGSSALYVKKTPDAKGSLVNHPVGYGYSGERYMPNAWMVLPSAFEKRQNASADNTTSNDTSEE